MTGVRLVRRAPSDESSATKGIAREKDDALTTDEWLRKRAAALRAKAMKLMTEADDLVKEATRLEATAREILAARQGPSRASEHLGGGRVHPHLRSREHRPRVEANMQMAELGAAISKGKMAAAKKAGVNVDPLVAAANAKGLSLRGLANEAAAAVGRKVPPSGLSQARRGERPIGPDVAEFIEQRIGFEASAKNWPGGIA